jgi:hypothetical protein
MKHLIETVETLRLRGIGFRSLTEALDTTTAQGRLVFVRDPDRIRKNLEGIIIAPVVFLWNRRKEIMVRHRSEQSTVRQFPGRASTAGPERGRAPQDLFQIKASTASEQIGPILPANRG